LSKSVRQPALGELESDSLLRRVLLCGVSLHFLQNREALELGMAEIERLVGAGAFMRLAKGP
jgi:hypothetical protein